MRSMRDYGVGTLTVPISQVRKQDTERCDDLPLVDAAGNEHRLRLNRGLGPGGPALLRWALPNEQGAGFTLPTPAGAPSPAPCSRGCS